MATSDAKKDRNVNVEKSQKRRDREHERSTNPDEHRDPITGAPGSHPLGTAAGAAVGGMGAAVVGAAIGSAVPGIGTVVGGAIGAAIGAFGGGAAGHDIAEGVNPTVEEAYWRENYKTRPYYSATWDYEEYAPAYRYGWESQSKYRGKRFEEVESDLASGWTKAKANSALDWEGAKPASRDAWERVDQSRVTEDVREAISTLNDLTETLKDGEQGFETAAKDVKDAIVKALFVELAQERSRFAGELQAEVIRLGGKPARSGDATAALHRGWIDLKAALGGGEKAVLNEAERGEDAAVRSYRKALEANNLLPAVAAMVRRQFDAVQQAHDRVRELRDSWNAR